jgi:hypothetical protein
MKPKLHSLQSTVLIYRFQILRFLDVTPFAINNLRFWDENVNISLYRALYWVRNLNYHYFMNTLLIVRSCTTLSFDFIEL